jgi:phage terminase large subunit GpA-like protein
MRKEKIMAEENGLKFIPERLFLGKMFSLLFSTDRLSTKDYAEKNIILSSEVTASPGKVSCLRTPCLLAFLKYADDPSVWIIIAKKPAQFGWTQIVNFYLENGIVNDPQNIIIAFPSDGLIKKYAKEKLRIAIKNSPKLTKLIGNPDKSSYDFYKFPGGWLSLVSAGSVNGLTSSSAPILIAEEPDRLAKDLKGQGGALSIFQERNKTFPNKKLIYGGTPIEEGFSNVDEAYELSNKMIFMVICQDCNEFHVLSFDNLKADVYLDKRVSKTFGIYDPETAYYECPHCSSRWTEEQKNLNLIKSIEFHDLGWIATAESHFIGFAYNELMSTFGAGSTLVVLMTRKLEADVEATKGKDEKLKAFTNNSMGLSYAPKDSNMDVKTLVQCRLNYPEMTVPAGGLVLTMGVDVQLNRLAIVINARGRNGLVWKVWWGEMFGSPSDPADEVWTQLEELYLSKIPHVFSTTEKPIMMQISAMSIDSGNWTKVVYGWVLKISKLKPYTFATKGDSSAGVTAREIFTMPVDPDTSTRQGERKRLYETMNIIPYIIGVQKAKKEVLRKVSLTVKDFRDKSLKQPLSGIKDRAYHYLDIREDYEDQLLSEREKGNPSRFTLIAGRRNEAFDCEVLDLHASYGIKLHTYQEKHWKQVEDSILKIRLPTVSSQNVTPGLGL